MMTIDVFQFGLGMFFGAALLGIGSWVIPTYARLIPKAIAFDRRENGMPEVITGDLQPRE